MPLGDTQDTNFGIFAEVKFRRASNIANVLNQHQIERVEVEFAETTLNERGFEVAGATGQQLDHRHPQLGDPIRIACRGNIAFQDTNPEVRNEFGNGFL